MTEQIVHTINKIINLEEPAGMMRFREGLQKRSGDQHFWAYIPAEGKWVEIADDHGFSFDQVTELATGRELVYDKELKGYRYGCEPPL